MATRSRVRNALVRGSRILVLAAYWSLTRLTLYALLACLSVYFILNAGPFPALLSDALRLVLPGTLQFDRLQIAPIPWKVDLLGVRIRTPEGRDVVTAGSLQVTLDLVPMVRFLAGHSGRLLEVAFRSVRLRDFWCEIAFDDRGDLEFLRAFVRPEEPEAAPSPPGTGPDVRLRFGHVIGERGRFHLSFPEWDLAIEDLSLDVSLTVREDGHVLIHAPVVTFSGGRGRIHAAPDVAEIPREVPLLRGRVEGFDFDTDHFSITRARIGLQGMDVDASGSLAFPSGGLLSYDARVLLSLPADSPLVAHATHDLVRGPMTLTVEGRGDEHDPRFHLALGSEGLSVAGMDLGPLSLAVDGSRVASGAWPHPPLEPSESGVEGGSDDPANRRVDGEPYAFHDLTLTADSPWGRWRVGDAAFYPFGSDPARPRIEARAVLDTENLDLPRLLQALGVPPWPFPVPLPHRVTGIVRASGAISSGESVTYEADVTARLSGSLGDRSLLHGREVRLTVASRVSWTPGTPVPGPQVHVRDVSVRSGADEMRARGTLDVGAGTVRATGTIVKDLASLFSAIGSEGQGRAVLSDIAVRGTWRDPSATAGIQVTDLAFAGWTLREARAQARLERGSITLSGLAAEAPYAHASVRSFRLSLPPQHPVMTLDGAAISRVNLMWVPTLRPLGLRGTGQATLDHLSFDLRNPLRSLAFSGLVTLPMLQVQDRRLQSVSATVRARDGHIEVPSLTARPHAGGAIRSSADLDLVHSTLTARVEADEVPLPFLTGLGDTLRGVVSLTASVAGPFQDPALDARVTVADASYKDISFGTIQLAARRESGQDLLLSSDRFLPKVRLDPSSGLVFRDGRFTAVQVRADIQDLTTQDILPSLRPRTFFARFTGRLDLVMGLGPGGGLRASLTSPPEGLALAFFDREVTYVNQDRLEVAVRESGEVTLSGLALSDGEATLRACGQVMDRDGRSRLLVRGPVSLTFLRTLKDVFSSARGSVVFGGLPGSAVEAPVGCSSDMTLGDGSLEVVGSFMAPALRGSIRTEAAVIGVRRVPDAIEVEPGGRAVITADDVGRMRVTIPSDAPVRGRMGDGRFTVDGNAAFQGWVPDTGILHLSGSGVRFSSPGAYYVVLAPDVTARFADMASPDPEVQRLVLAGRVDITEGSYHRNYDVVRKAFSGVAGTRVAERPSTPLSVSAPWLARASLDLAVTGSRFGVRSRLPFGATDLEVALDLAVRGTIENPEVWNRVEVLPGGQVIYNVVRREFEVTRGTADFDGDPGRPLLDVTARTTVDQTSATASEVGGGSRFEPETRTGSADSGVVITLAVSGRFPDLDVSLTSNSRDLDQTDLQYLLLTGATQRDAAEGRSGLIDLGLVTEDMTNLVTNLFLSPFVDAIRFGVSPSGGVNAAVEAHLGSRLRFETQVLQESGGSRYRAGFQVRLTDRLFLEGRLRAVEQSTDPSEVGRRYEAKLRYRIPIE